MASSWIKVEVITPDKPEIFQIAETLAIDPDAVLGKLVRIWAWADQQTVDGNAGSVTKSVLDRLSFVTGFADALISVGWLAQTDGKLFFPNFERHNGESSKKRALTNRRVTNLRQNREKSNADSVTSAFQKALPEEEEEEDIKDPPISPVGDDPPTTKSKPKSHPIDYQAVVDAYNKCADGKLPMVQTLNEKRRRDIKRLLSELAEPTPEAAKAYFQRFMDSAKPWHFGDNDRGWVANFDYLLKSKTLVNTREGSL